MTELMAGLVALVVLVAGLAQLISLTKIDTVAMRTARMEAGQDALNMVYQQGNPAFIRDWEEGGDEKSYTRDDEFTDGDSGRFRSAVVGRAGSTESDWATLGRVPNNRVSLMAGGQEPSEAFGLVRGHESVTTNLVPAVRSLLYRADSIEIESEVWMTWTTGIY